MKLYYQNKRAEQYQVEFTSKNNDAINVLIDQLNRDGITFIKSEQFNTDVKLMTIDIMDVDSKYKVGELTFNESYLGEDRSILEI